MIDVHYARRMARYNRWQNENLYGAADGLRDEERRRERGAFFGSIHRTLNHLLWGDRAWLSRFSDVPLPDLPLARSSELIAEWADLKRERAAFDAFIIGWADALEPRALEGDMTYFAQAAQREITAPRWFLVTHIFNHQAHHRGQVHCMLTQAGVRPGDTDMVFLEE